MVARVYLAAAGGSAWEKNLDHPWCFVDIVSFICPLEPGHLAAWLPGVILCSSKAEKHLAWDHRARCSKRFARIGHNDVGHSKLGSFDQLVNYRPGISS